MSFEYIIGITIVIVAFMMGRFYESVVSEEKINTLKIKHKEELIRQVEASTAKMLEAICQTRKSK